MKSKKIIAAVVLLVSGVMLGAVIFSGFNFIRPGLANIVLGAKTPPVNLNADASAFS
ncbi:MAG: trypsin, partial [Ignavibacteriales bacterium]|nr:trypsin [Ignavibacteriales bacterium]